eukprot:jgi/Mesvir1/6481/Mv19554-RA.1
MGLAGELGEGAQVPPPSPLTGQGASPGHQPVLLTFPSPEDKQRLLSRRKRLHDPPHLDAGRRPHGPRSSSSSDATGRSIDQWPEYLRHKQDPQKPCKVYWRGGDLIMINHIRDMWTPPAGWNSPRA